MKPKTVGLSNEQAAQIKGMVLRGDRQQDIAAWFGVNQGTVSKISSGMNFTFRSVPPAPDCDLPPPGPYLLVNQAEYGALKRAHDILLATANTLAREMAAIGGAG